ncbi:type IV pilus assembly protein PilM [Clostridium aestuarii]|uniref:Type IV pilus assembly protein PilM n=1 Tax=Clostridium aestuarii TaxID=338193 RepID=A0ABT4D022_9CLOT|nr:type IV pilus assembly protein PilM [Clostridium aestuarii]MCY6484581.1 type IV pilus assembly protein PilM [Clostridium aestuarii]
MFNSKLLSIDIGTKNIKIIEAKQNGEKIIVDKAFTVKTPENCFDDGNIVNMITMKQKIEEVLKKENLKSKRVVVTSKSTSLITRVIEVPFQKKDKEFNSLINYEIQQYLPINFEDYITKYIKLEDFEKDEVKMTRVRVAVYPKIVAKAYWDLVTELKLNPVALQISSNSVAKLFYRNNTMINDENISSKETVVIIDIGADYLELNFILNGQLKFTRILSGGGSYLDANIASELFIQEEEAENKKINMCDLSLDEHSEHPEAEIINNSVKLVVDRWISEIHRMLEYYRNLNKDETIKKIYLHGGSSNLKGLCEYMESALNTPIDKIESMDNIVLQEQASNITIENYLNAIGAVIRRK